MSTKLVQELPVPGSESEDSVSRGSQGGVSFWGVVSSRGVHRDQPGDGQPCSGGVLQQAGDGGAVDQRRQAGGQDDAAELPPVPVEGSAAMAEPDRLQLGKPLAAAGAAEENRELVADQFAAAAGQSD